MMGPEHGGEDGHVEQGAADHHATGLRTEAEPEQKSTQRARSTLILSDVRGL